MADCRVCFGKGKWMGISDSAWRRDGPKAKPDKLYGCGACRGAGKVKTDG